MKLYGDNGVFRRLDDGRQPGAGHLRIFALGHVFDAEEDALGVMCVAATFSDHAGQVAGAISATGLSGTLQARGVDTLAGEVRAAAGRVTTLLGGGERREALL